MPVITKMRTDGSLQSCSQRRIHRAVRIGDMQTADVFADQHRATGGAQPVTMAFFYDEERIDPATLPSGDADAAPASVQQSAPGGRRYRQRSAQRGDCAGDFGDS